MQLGAKHVLIAAGLIAGAIGVARLLSQDKAKKRKAEGPTDTAGDEPPIELPVVLSADELAELVRNNPSRLIINIQREPQR